jgi:capsular polysaccharide export protein
MVVGFGTKRSFLFLQGLATPFWLCLASEMQRRGHSVHRILLSGGDRVFWPMRGAVSYRGHFSGWRAFLGGFLHETGISDIVLFGDCRPYHRVAMELARSRGIAVHVFEEGYFRPQWITVEREGTNAFSSLPRDAKSLFEEAAQLGAQEDTAQHVSGGFAKRVVWEVLNQTAMLLLAPLYPHYRRHRTDHPVVEFGGWLKRLFKGPYERHHTVRLSRYLEKTDRPYYLLPLQLETDYQIRRHSRFKSMTDVMELTMESFARSAPADSLLVVKLHPLDNGLVNFRKRAKRIARNLNLEDRVFVMDGGHLPSLLSKARGVVVVNSTTGLSALHRGRAVKVLGNALFDIPGLTFQGPIDSFWQSDTKPDMELYRAFQRVVLARAQVNGSFFTRAGIALGVDGALERMEVFTAASIVLPQTKPERSKIAAPKPAVLVGH